MLGLFIKLLFLAYLATPKPVEPEMVILPEPQLQHGLDAIPEELLQIEVQVNGVIRAKGEELNIQGLEALLVKEIDAKPDLGVALTADRDLRVEELAAVIDLLKKLEIDPIMLVAKGEP